MHPSDLREQLAQFTGSETFTRHSLAQRPRPAIRFWNIWEG